MNQADKLAKAQGQGLPVARPLSKASSGAKAPAPGNLTKKAITAQNWANGWTMGTPLEALKYKIRAVSAGGIVGALSHEALKTLNTGSRPEMLMLSKSPDSAPIVHLAVRTLVDEDEQASSHYIGFFADDEGNLTTRSRAVMRHGTFGTFG